MKKRVLAVLLAVTMLLALIPVYATGNPAFAVESVTAKAGETMDVTIRVVNNPGIASIKLKVNYDTNLTLNSVTYNTAIGGMSMQPQKMNSPVTLNWFNGLADTNGDWVFATLSFTVADTAAAGTYPITVTYEADNVYNIAEENITFAIENGGVTIECPHEAKTEVPSKSADCVHSGNNLYYTCDSCGLVFKADGVTETTVEAETIPALGHDWKDANCTSPKTCRREGCAYTEGTALGHDYTVKVEDSEHLRSAASKCTEYNTYWYACSRCGDISTTEYFTGTTAGGHAFSEKIEDEAHLVSGSGADCQHAKQYYYDCANCDTMGTETWNSTTCGEHKMDTAWTSVNGEHYHKCTVSGCDYAEDKASCTGGTATCTKKAVCGTCGKVYGQLLEHDLTHHEGNEANHFHPGNIAYWTCDACGKYFSDASAKTEIQEKDIAIAQIPHSHSTSWSQSATQHWNECACGDKINIYAHVYDNACDTACNTCGYTRTTTHSWNTAYSFDGTQHWIECSVCHEKKEIASHTGGTATCQVKKECTICHQAYGELADCDFTAEVVDNKYLVSEATCVAKAVYYKSCTVCGTAGPETFESGTVSTANHVGGTYLDGKLDTTCIAEGYTGDIKCNSCHAIITAGSAVGKTDHTPSASWSTDGEYHWKTCQTNGCTEILEKTAHSGGAATCKDAAVCTACGVSYGNKNADHHTGNTELRDAKVATCTEAGYTGDTWCKDCGAKLATGEAIPGGHKLTHVTAKAATHTESGHIEYWSCDVCQKLYSNDEATTEVTAVEVAIAAVGHTYGETYKQDADKHWKECSCGDKSQEAAHTYGQWVTTKKADVGVEGCKERACSVCGYKQTEKIPATMTPATGDNTLIGSLLALLLLSACGMITMRFLVPQKKGKYQR